MLRISKLTDYATVILARLAAVPTQRRTAAEVAEATGLSLPTASKLLKELQRAGLVSSTRGSHGGYQLTRPAADISAAAILDAIEGPVAITECSGHESRCGLEHACGVGRAWQKINAAIHRSLSDLTLAQLAGLDKPAAADFCIELHHVGRPSAARTRT